MCSTVRPGGRPLVRSSWALDPFGYGPTQTYLLQRAGIENLAIHRINAPLKKFLAEQLALEFDWLQPFGAHHDAYPTNDC